MRKYSKRNGKAVYLKVFYQAVVFILLALCLAGCGSGEKEADNSLPAEYYDIRSSKKEVFKVFGSSEAGMYLGMQYYQGEIVQLRTESFDVYLLHEDGSRELLAENVREAPQQVWYLDGEGNRYCWEKDFVLSELMGQDRKENYSILKADSAGKEIFRTQLSPGVRPVDICQLADGRMILLLENQTDGGTEEVAELDPVTGLLTVNEAIQLPANAARRIAAGTQGLLLLEDGISAGISEINLADGKALSNQSLTSGSYSLGGDSASIQIQDFCIQEDGGVQILWADPETAKGIRETLRLEKIERTVIVMATPYTMNDWLKAQIVEFNRTNDTYYVMANCGNNVNYKEFLTRLLLEVSTGKGPDILYEDALWNQGALVEQGFLEDLAPYMEESGIKEEDYFPAAFSYWREGEEIYAVSLEVGASYGYIRAEVMGGKEPESIEEYLDAMLSWEDEEILEDYWGPSRYLLSACLVYSEDMRGMIDWEEGTCDFGGELFVKMMDYAKRYGIHTMAEALKWHGKPVEINYTTSEYADSFLGFSTVEEMRQQGWVRDSGMFDDGIHPVAAGSYPTSVLAVNANSDHKQGAWEFISFLLSEKAQKARSNEIYHTSSCSVNRKVFMEELDKEIAEIHNREQYSDAWKGKDAEERIQEYINKIETGRDMSINYRKLDPIIDIIEEESEAYFTDTKSAEEVVEIINNRVQLYLDER